MKTFFAGIFIVQVSDEDYDLAMYNWSISDCGYPRESRKGKTTYLHQLIAKRMGIIGLTDHKDRNPLNAQRENLRPCSISQNNMNQDVRSNKLIQIKGVTYDKRYHVFTARIRVNYKLITLGNFSNRLDAGRAYNQAALHYHGEFAVLNQLENL